MLYNMDFQFVASEPVCFDQLSRSEFSANCLLFLFPGVWGTAFGGMPTGPKVFLDLAGRVLGAALRLDPLFKKPLCRTCLVVGRRTNKVLFYITRDFLSLFFSFFFFFFLLKWHDIILFIFSPRSYFIDKKWWRFWRNLFKSETPLSIKFEIDCF